MNGSEEKPSPASHTSPSPLRRLGSDTVQAGFGGGSLKLLLLHFCSLLDAHRRGGGFDRRASKGGSTLNAALRLLSLNTCRTALNLIILTQSWQWKGLHLEKPLKYRYKVFSLSISDVSKLRFIPKVRWKHLFCIFCVTGRDVWVT